MSRDDLTRHFRNRPWRVRAVWLAIAATGLAAAFAGAEIMATPDTNAMTRTITRQRVAAGEAARPPARESDKPLTPDQIFAAVASYEGDMTKALEHGESLRIHAYRSRDIIRMTCVDEKLGQMKEIMAIAKPRFTTIKNPMNDELQLRSQYTTLREGWERINQLSADMESCMGDSLEAIAAAGIPEEQNGPGAAVDDPTLPPNPTVTLDRPGYASPFR
jgi:hypothetical protein